MYSISSRQTARNYYVSLQISILRGRSSNTFNPISLLFSITNDSVEVLLFHCRRVDSAAVAATERREQWKKNNEFRQIFNGRHSTISLLLLLLFDQRAPITQQENQWNEELCVRFVCFWFFFFVLVLNLSLASKFVNARVLCLFGRGRYYSTHWPCVYTIAYAKMHKIIHYKHSHAHRTQAHTTPIYICSQRTYGSILWKNGFCCCCRIERWIKWKPSLVRVLILYI